MNYELRSLLLLIPNERDRARALTLLDGADAAQDRPPIRLCSECGRFHRDDEPCPGAAQPSRDDAERRAPMPDLDPKALEAAARWWDAAIDSDLATSLDMAHGIVTAYLAAAGGTERGRPFGPEQGDPDKLAVERSGGRPPAPAGGADATDRLETCATPGETQVGLAERVRALEAELDGAQGKLAVSLANPCATCQRRADQAEVRVRQLTEALEEIWRLSSHPNSDPRCWDIARAALAESPAGEETQ